MVREEALKQETLEDSVGTEYALHIISNV